MCMVVVLTVVGPPAVQCSAQHRQRRYIVDLLLLMRPRESTNDCAREKFSWRASSSSLPDAGRSATYSRSEAAFVRRARHAVVRK